MIRYRVRNSPYVDTLRDWEKRAEHLSRHKLKTHNDDQLKRPTAKRVGKVSCSPNVTSEKWPEMRVDSRAIATGVNWLQDSLDIHNIC